MTEIEVAVEYLKRKYRYTYPDGHSKGKKWYPYEIEHAKCCDTIRSPSNAYPWSLMIHCKSLKHLCTLHDANISKVRKILGKKGVPLLVNIDHNVVKHHIRTLMGEEI